jgi:hypothetical protein
MSRPGERAYISWIALSLAALISELNCSASLSTSRQTISYSVIKSLVDSLDGIEISPEGSVFEVILRGIHIGVETEPLESIIRVIVFEIT